MKLEEKPETKISYLIKYEYTGILRICTDGKCRGFDRVKYSGLREGGMTNVAIPKHICKVTSVHWRDAFFFIFVSAFGISLISFKRAKKALWFCYYDVLVCYNKQRRTLKDSFTKYHGSG